MIETLYQLQTLYKQFSSKTDGFGKIFYRCVVQQTKPITSYGTYYIQHLPQLEKFHPSSLDEIRSFISIRWDEIGIEQAIDLAVEQT